jgi:hypothetical protein
VNYLVGLAVLAVAVLSWWLLAIRLTKVGFDQSREDLFEEGPFKEWLFAREKVLIFGRDMEGYSFVMVFGFLEALQIRRMARANGISTK